MMIRGMSVIPWLEGRIVGGCVLRRTGVCMVGMREGVGVLLLLLLFSFSFLLCLVGRNTRAPLLEGEKYA
jgi:hypothetical protein